MSPNMPEQGSHGVAREKKDFDLRVIVWTAVITVLVAVGVHIGLRYLQLNYNRQAAQQDPQLPPTAAARETPPGPDLRPTPIRDLHHFRREQQAQLEGYAWGDDKREQVHIPIERAMELLVERGLPAPPESKDSPSETESPDESPPDSKPSPESP